jgi:excisionase family DNA binding protein
MTPDETGRQWVTIGEACLIAGVSRRTVYNWLQAGKLTTRRTAGGNLRIAADSLWQKPETA